MPAFVEPKPALRGKPRHSRAFTQAKQLQDLLFDDAFKDGVKPLERSSLARVWCELEETKRKLRMRPLPKSVDVSHNGKPLTKVKPQTTPTFSE